jgi:hypothetical protein
VRRVAAGAVEALGGTLLALAFCALGLAEAGAARRRLVRAVPDRATPRRARRRRRGGRGVPRYAWVKTLTSAITGTATALAALAIGLPLAWVWGFLTFLLEFIPSVGSVLAVLPPTLMAVADGGPARGAATFFSVGALQLVLGNVVDPKLEGRFMAVSPFVGAAGHRRCGGGSGGRWARSRRADDRRDGHRVPPHAGRARRGDAAVRRAGRRGGERGRRLTRRPSERPARRPLAGRGRPD